MTEIQEKLLDILLASNNPILQIQWEMAKLQDKLPIVSKFIDAIEANFQRGIYTPIEISTIDNAFDAVTIMYKLKIDSNNQLTESDKELQKNQLTKNREINKLFIKCFLLAVNILITNADSHSGHNNQKDIEQYKTDLEQKGIEFFKNYQGAIQSSLHQLFPNSSKDEFEQLTTSLNTYIENLFTPSCK